MVRILILWIAYWFFVVGGLIYVLVPLGADQLHNNVVTCFYFLFFAGLSAYFYRVRTSLNHLAPWRVQLKIIALTVVLYVFLSVLIGSLVPFAPGNYERVMRSQFYFPLFLRETITTKIFDVLFQQVTIFGLIIQLSDLKLTKTKIVFLFSFVFFIIHLPLLESLGLYSIYFIVPSTFAGTLFSYLILTFRYGFGFSYATHLLFYLLVGIYLRVNG